MADSYCLYGRVTLTIMSRSLKSNRPFPIFQQCIYASLVKISQLIQSITLFWTLQSAGVTMKITSMPTRSNQPLTSSKQRKYASFSASLVMPIGDPRDRLFYSTLTRIMDYFSCSPVRPFLKIYFFAVLLPINFSLGR